MGQGQVANQSGTSWYPVITASSYKVAVLVLRAYIENRSMEENEKLDHMLHDHLILLG